uniref:Putative secreted protein n=1 Tax=Anopheles darlingi TaxID=43151 RepID=A0A2M4DNA2_ANODA
MEILSLGTTTAASFAFILAFLQQTAVLERIQSVQLQERVLFPLVNRVRRWTVVFRWQEPFVRRIIRRDRRFCSGNLTR